MIFLSKNLVSTGACVKAQENREISESLIRSRHCNAGAAFHATVEIIYGKGEAVMRAKSGDLPVDPDYVLSRKMAGDK